MLDLGPPTFKFDLPYLVNGQNVDDRLAAVVETGPPEEEDEMRIQGLDLPMAICPFGNYPVVGIYGPFAWHAGGPPSLEPDAPEYHVSRTGLVGHH
jgi:hypothetical protein